MRKFFIFVCVFFLGLGQKSSAYEIAVISLFRNTAPYIKEWIEYHHMIGVDHFWLYNDASTDNWEEVLKPYIEEGLVEVFYWPAGKPDWTSQQISAFQDGVQRAIGICKWVALIDQDEFLLPMQDGSLKDCLEKHFSKESAVYVNWRNFGTSNITLDKDEPMISRLTSCSTKNHWRNSVGKSIYRPECVIINQMWSPHFCPLKEELQYINGDGAYTLTRDGTNLKTDFKHHAKYIRINHYAFRDEKYFWHVRLPRDQEPKLILSLYNDYNQEYDTTILDFIKRYYPHMFENYWEKFMWRSRRQESKKM